ncbi:pentatricopeptide repeat-containing protein At1g73710 [Phragmites australis]|uniref:pentatricopeptide repeat-containing protein At1g73710 n=1 Tax=Phragmites australis TaxID=29695 RepID=UPI002D7736F9|nr:pentatricopeptide repeat-containing protein At1g73710 [Phragmites australis]
MTSVRPCPPAAGAGARSIPLPSPPTAGSHLHLPRLPPPPPLSSSSNNHSPFPTATPVTPLHPSDEVLSAMSPREQTSLLSRQRHWRCARDLFDRLRALPGYAPNPVHYAVLLRHLARAQRWAELRRAWLGMVLPPSNPAYAALADALAKAGLVREALLLLRHMRARGVAPDEVSMNTFVRVLKDEGRYADALALFRNWCDGKFEVDFLDLDCSMVDLDGPMRFLLDEICDDKVVDAAGVPGVVGGTRKLKLVATYNTMIDLYGKAGQLKDALDMFMDMPAHGIMADTYTFNTLINVFGLSGNMAQAEALFGSMVVRGIKPDTKTYNVMMTVFASRGDSEGVLKYYHQIGKEGLHADPVSYRIVLQALCERKMVREAEDVVEWILNNDSFVHEQSLPIVMKMYVDLGLLNEANTFFERHCRVKGVSSKNVAAIMDAFAEKGLWEEAEHIFYSERGVGNKDIVEYNVMVKAYGQAKQYDRVSSLLESMKESGVSPDSCTYNSLIQMFSVGGFPQIAKKLLDEMKNAGFKPKCETYCAVTRSYSRHYLVPEAIDLFSEMKASGVEPNIVVYGLLIDMFAEIGNVNAALHYSNLLEESGISPNQVILTSLIKAYSKANCWKEAQVLYSRMKNMDGGPDIIASNAMLNLYANLGMVTEATEIFDKLRKNSHADDVSYSTMIYLYKGMGLLGESIKIAHELQKSGLLSDCASYNAVMACYVARGNLRHCAELVQQMVAANIPPDASTFGMIFSLLNKGYVSTEEVLQLESAYNDGRNSAKQAIVALLFSTAGIHAAALEICEQLLRPEWTVDPCAYNICFKVYASCRKVEKAFSLFTRMHDLGLKPDTVTCIHLTTCYGKSGMSEGLRTNGLLEYRNDKLSIHSNNALVAYIETGKK